MSEEGKQAIIEMINTIDSFLDRGAKERYMNAGFSDFPEKPIAPEKLEETLRTYLPKDLIEE